MGIKRFVGPYRVRACVWKDSRRTEPAEINVRLGSNGIAGVTEICV